MRGNTPSCFTASYYSLQRISSGRGLVWFYFLSSFHPRTHLSPWFPSFSCPNHPSTLHCPFCIPAELLLSPCPATLSLLRSIRAPSPRSLPASIHSSVPPSLMICHGDWQQLIGLIPPWGLVALWPIWIQLSHCPAADTMTLESRQKEGERRGSEMVREGCIYLQV